MALEKSGDSDERTPWIIDKIYWMVEVFIDTAKEVLWNKSTSTEEDWEEESREEESYLNWNTTQERIGNWLERLKDILNSNNLDDETKALLSKLQNDLMAKLWLMNNYNPINIRNSILINKAEKWGAVLRIDKLLNTLKEWLFLISGSLSEIASAKKLTVKINGEEINYDGLSLWFSGQFNSELIERIKNTDKNWIHRYWYPTANLLFKIHRWDNKKIAPRHNWKIITSITINSSDWNWNWDYESIASFYLILVEIIKELSVWIWNIEALSVYIPQEQVKTGEN